jgi:hypothetical protein
MTVNSAESKDRVFLCQLLVVLALAESMDASRQPAINQFADGGATPEAAPAITGTSTSSPPGKEFFEQALALFNIPYEDATIEHIEILNMFVRQSVHQNNYLSGSVLNGIIDTVFKPVEQAEDGFHVCWNKRQVVQHATAAPSIHEL